MKTTIIIKGMDQVRHVIDLLTRLPLDGTKCVEIKDFKKKRSLDQNSLLHKWLTVIADETGNSLEAVKDEMKRKFLGVVMREFTYPNGKVAMLPSLRSTTELNTKEMTTFLNQIEALASEFGIILPHPEDLYWSIQ